MNRFFKTAFFSLLISCNGGQFKNGTEVQKGEEQAPLNEEKEYHSGVNKRFEKSFINRKGLFFDDFEKLPQHTSPKEYQGKEYITRYSYHSVVEKEDWAPKNNSIEVIGDQTMNYLKSTLSPGQLHTKIKGYRAELTLQGGNPELEEEWYEWRFMIPETYVIDKNNIGKEVCIVQFHYVKPKGEKKIINRPTVHFSYLEQYSKNMLLLRYGINGEDKFKFKNYKWRLIALHDKIEKGKWYTIRVNIKWSLTNDGYIAVWLNGKPFTPYNGIHNKVFGANLYNTIQNTVKFGYYRYWDNSNPTSVYFDYFVKTRSFESLTGKEPKAAELYGTSDDYRYLENKEQVLKDISFDKDL